ncbi:MAG TPA: hypothetical protein VFQ22_10110, partial [Longimicrobiales bacterium]|nr:hypothetical protein [Longimicrobiales bacterium]
MKRSPGPETSTMMRALAASLAATSLLLGAPAAAAAQSEMIAYTGATLWDGTGAPPVPDATLVVRDGRIVSVGASAPIPAGAREVSLDGRFVIPGLVESHGHVDGSWAPEGVRDPV